MSGVPLAEARDEARYGGKAVQLGEALRARLPVPEGIAVPVEAVEAIGRGDGTTRARLVARCADLGDHLAVRSSAIGEDSAAASFAGQHATLLNVRPDGVPEAVATVWRSGASRSALAYRRRVGDDAAPRMGVVVQRLVPADVAGVLFTRDPVTNSDERVIEASWGLGEAVVQGLVVPDQFRIARDGRVLARRAGHKDTAVRMLPGGDTERQPVEGALARALCLDDPMLAALAALAERCERRFGAGPHDLEWAFASGRLLLLQRRAVTGAAVAPGTS